MKDWLYSISIFRLWCLMAIPGGLLCGGILAAWNAMIGADPLTAFLGGLLGIAWSFPINGWLIQRFGDEA